MEISVYKIGEPLNISMPNKQFFELIGETGLREIVSNHYDLLRKSEISSLFPQSDEAFEQAKKNSADFFVQILGGKPYYKENRGNPMLLRRHKPFKITAQGREVWLNCYKQVLSTLDGVPENITLSFWNYLDEFSKRMVNA